jgi:hypothetical protein
MPTPSELNTSIYKMPVNKVDDTGCVESVEDIEDSRLKDKETGVFESNLDYSGASAKVDPLEISLVKKLDRRIMPTLWAMYFLNYVSKRSLTENGLSYSG